MIAPKARRSAARGFSRDWRLAIGNGNGTAMGNNLGTVVVIAHCGRSPQATDYCLLLPSPDDRKRHLTRPSRTSARHASFLSKPLERVDLGSYPRSRALDRVVEECAGLDTSSSSRMPPGERIATAGGLHQPGAELSGHDRPREEPPEGNDFDIGRLAQNPGVGRSHAGSALLSDTAPHRCGAEVLGLSDGQSWGYAAAFGYPDPRLRKHHAPSVKQWERPGESPQSDMIRSRRTGGVEHPILVPGA